MSQTRPAEPVPEFQDRLEENEGRVAWSPLSNSVF